MCWMLRPVSIDTLKLVRSEGILHIYMEIAIMLMLIHRVGPDTLTNIVYRYAMRGFKRSTRK